MFTVKATYRSETRKFSFSSPSFPTYTQLSDQVDHLSLSCSSLTDFSSLSAYFRLARPIILLVSFSPSLLVLLLLVFSLVWRLIQRKSTNSMFVPSVVASDQMVSFVSPYMTMRQSHPTKPQTICPPSRMMKTS